MVVLWGLSLLPRAVSPDALAQSPAAGPLGALVAADGTRLPLSWTCKGVDAAMRAGVLHLEIEAKKHGTAQTAMLPLEPLRLYDLSFTCRRGPGTGLSVSVSYTGADGKPASRNIVFQLRDAPRPNYWPLAPYRQEYVQRFCLPPGAKDASLQLALTGHPDAGLNFVDVYGVSLAAGAKVPFGENLGPNLLTWGDMESADDSGVPWGWSTWVNKPAKMDVVRRDAAGRGPHGGERFLGIAAGKGFILAAGELPIEAGRAYLISFWTRGKADLGVGVHALEHVHPYPTRVGDPQPRPFRVDGTTWTRHEYLWFAESLFAASGQLFISISPQTELHLDDVKFQRIEP
jgi:hypothetical protein